MGVYSDDYVCRPHVYGPWWFPVVCLQFIVVFLGCASHWFFMSTVIFAGKFGSYLRLCFFFISIQMILMLLTSSGAFIITLSHGKFIEDCEISAIPLRKYLLYIHSFGEYFFVVCELLGTTERVISSFDSDLRKTRVFKVCFFTGGILGVFGSLFYIWLIRISFKRHLFAIGFGSLTLMEVANGIVVIILMIVAKKKYKSEKIKPLNAKFELSQSFAYSKCAVVSFIARVAIISYVYMKIAGFFEDELDSPFFYWMNLAINFYCLVYPWTIMLCHRRTRNEILKTLRKRFFHRPNKIHEVNKNNSLYTIDGKKMNNEMTTDSHFQQLDTFWNKSVLPPALRV